METIPQPSETNPRLLEALSSLNQIGEAINQANQEVTGDRHPILNLVVNGATRVVPGAAAVIYTFDENRNTFDPSSRVSAGERTGSIPNDTPRPQGIGMRAIKNGKRV